MPQADSQPAEIVDEQGQVELRRYREARQAGLEHKEASIFAVGGEDVGVLRQLVRDGCPAGLIARIII